MKDTLDRDHPAVWLEIQKIAARKVCTIHIDPIEDQRLAFVPADALRDEIKRALPNLSNDQLTEICVENFGLAESDPKPTTKAELLQVFHQVIDVFYHNTYLLPLYYAVGKTSQNLDELSQMTRRRSEPTGLPLNLAVELQHEAGNLEVLADPTPSSASWHPGTPAPHVAVASVTPQETGTNRRKRQRRS